MIDDINTMFMEKNFEILKNKINLDINNNADSLNHTISNFIDLKKITVIRYLEDTYNDLNIKYKNNKIDDFLEEESKKLKEISLEQIINRKNKIAEYLDRDVDFSKIDDKYIEDFHKYINDLTDELDSNVEVALREEICVNFSPKLSVIYKLHDIESKDNLVDYINNSYCETIIDKIKSEVRLRNETLKNLSLEAFERFKSMNEKTVE